MVRRLQSKAGEHPGAGGEAWRDRDSLAWDELAGDQPYANEPVVPDFEGRDLPFHDADATSPQLLGLLLGRGGRGVLKEDHVGAQLPEQQRLMHGHWARPQDADLLIADLPPVAVGTMQHVQTPTLPDPLNVRQLVDEPRGDEQPPGTNPAAILQCHGEATLSR